MRIPSREAPPIPPKNERGTDTTSAHGHDTTRKTQALVSHTDQMLQSDTPRKTGGITARSTAAATTQGVYHLANLVIKFSTLAFFSDEFSTSSRIFDTVLSPNVLVVFTVITPVRLSVPDITLSDTDPSTGEASPVRAAVLTVVSPSITMPSSGIFSPGLTITVSPTATLSGGTRICSPFLTATA